MKSGVFILKDHTNMFIRDVHTMSKKAVWVGIPASSTTREGQVTNSMIAYVNEFGSPARGIPPRPFLSVGIKSVQEKTDELLASATGNNLNTILVKIGLIAVASIKETIVKGEGFRQLSLATLKSRQRKGFAGTKPLIETGQLLNSIKFEVRNA